MAEFEAFYGKRIERTGEIEPLTPQIIQFLKVGLRGMSLDDLQSPETTRIDYSCMGGLLAVELKSLEEPGTERLDNLTDELRDRADWPIFMGSAPMQAFIQNLDDPEGVERRVIDRIGRNFINHLKKADRQLKAHGENFPRTNMVKLIIFINEDHEIFDPHTVAYILWHAIRRMNGDEYIYKHVDCILYITQRHAKVLDDKVAYPILTIEGAACWDDPWKADVVNLVAQRWSAWNGCERFEQGSIEEFVTIDHIPETAPLYERWRTEYKRNPYLRNLSKDDLIDRFIEIATLNSLDFLKNSPVKFDQSQILSLIRQFGDLTQEFGDRAIPITEVNHGNYILDVETAFA